MGHLPHNEQYLLDQRVIMRVSRLQQLLATLHFCATHVIFKTHLLYLLIYLINRVFLKRRPDLMLHRGGRQPGEYIRPNTVLTIQER